MEPLDRTSLAEQAVEAIKRQILTHHLQAGDRLPSERELCETLGISRSILREALGTLVGQGIVSKVSGKGVFVEDFDRCSLGVDVRLTITDEAELGALQDLRSMLEIGVLELVARRSTSEELDELEVILEEVEQKLFQNGWVDYLDAEFHLALFKAAHTPALLPLYEQVLRDVTIFRNPKVPEGMTQEVSMANLSLLREVLDALRRGDVREAQVAMKAHIFM